MITMNINKIFCESVASLGLTEDKYNKVIACFESSLNQPSETKAEAERCLAGFTKFIKSITQSYPTHPTLPGITQYVYTCLERLAYYLKDNEELESSIGTIRENLQYINMYIQSYNHEEHKPNLFMHVPGMHDNRETHKMNYNMQIQQHVRNINNELDLIKDAVALLQ